MSTSQYPEEARHHVLEIYESISPEDLRTILSWLEEVGREGFLRDFVFEWQREALVYLGKTPSREALINSVF